MWIMDGGGSREISCKKKKEKKITPETQVSADGLRKQQTNWRDGMDWGAALKGNSPEGRSVTVKCG